MIVPYRSHSHITASEDANTYTSEAVYNSLKEEEKKVIDKAYEYVKNGDITNAWFTWDKHVPQSSTRKQELDEVERNCTARDGGQAFRRAMLRAHLIRNGKMWDE